MGHRWILGAAALIVGGAQAQADPPASVIKPVVDRYGDTAVVDNYRWLEDANSARTKDWEQRQNEYARSFLDRLPDRDAIRSFKRGLESGSHVFYWNIRESNGTYFALKDAPPNEQSMLVALTNPDDLSTERTIFDPNRASVAGATSINWYRPSPDGRLVAVCLSGNTERGDIHVFETATGNAMNDVVPRVNYATAGGNLSWLADGSGFLYTHYPRPGERPDSDLDFYTRVYRHNLGAAAATDTYEVGNDFSKLAEIRLFGGDNGWQFARVADGDGQRFSFYARSAAGRWSKFLSPEDGVVQVAPAGDRLLLLSTKRAARGEVLALPLQKRGPDPLYRAKLFAPQPPVAAIQSIFVPRNATTQSQVFLVERNGGPDLVEIRDLAGKAHGTLAMPAVAELSEWVSIGSAKVMYCATQYVAPMQCYWADAPTKPLAISERSSVRLDDIEVTREFATSADGIRIPMTILHRRGMPVHASAPTIMTGYGESGGERPWFNVNLRLLGDAGVTWVDTNVRGGMDYGLAWHRAGEMLKKQNSFDDFVACARRLIELGYTDPEHLVIDGSSAGGLLVTAAVTQHPELFKAAVSAVGIYDMLRVELGSNGQFNTTQYGSTRISEQFRVLYAYSPYHHVVDDHRYPDVLLLASATDSHVDPMHSRKMTARLQEATKGRSLVLLRTSTTDGHGINTSFSEEVEQQSDSLAFEFFELGVHFVRGE